MAFHSYNPRYDQTVAWHYGDDFTCVGSIEIKRDLWLYKLGIPIQACPAGGTVIPYILDSKGDIILKGPEQEVNVPVGQTFWAEFDKVLATANLPDVYYVGYWSGNGSVVSYGHPTEWSSNGWGSKKGIRSRIGKSPGPLSSPSEVNAPAFGFYYSDTPPNTAPRVPIFTYPSEGQSINTKTPTMTWEYFDPEGDIQGAFRIELLDARYRRIIWDSGWIISSIPKYTLPSGILKRDGKYQLRITIKDSSGLETIKDLDDTRREFYLDTVSPTISRVSDLQLVKGSSCKVWAYGVDDELSGVDRISVSYTNPDRMSGIIGDAIRAGTSNNFYVDFRSLNVDGDWRFDFKAFDRAGNMSNIVSAYVKRDTVSPSPPVFTLTKTGWTNTNVTFSLEHGVDPGTGIDRTEYKIGIDDSWKTYTAPVIMDSTATVYARTIDTVGNISSEASAEISIDKIRPLAPAIFLSTKDWTKSNVTVTIQDGNDYGGAGVLRSEYKIGTDGLWNTYTAPISIPTATTVFARTIDRAENISLETFSDVRIDKVAPTDPVINVSRNAWGTDPVAVTITPGTDTVSGISSTEYRIGNGIWKRYTGPITVKEATVVQARSTDRAKNVSAVVSKQIFIWDGRMSLEEAKKLSDKVGAGLSDPGSLGQIKAPGYGGGLSLGDIMNWMDD